MSTFPCFFDPGGISFGETFLGTEGNNGPNRPKYLGRYRGMLLIRLVNLLLNLGHNGQSHTADGDNVKQRRTCDESQGP
jgi:hypothetical protein